MEPEISQNVFEGPGGFFTQALQFFEILEFFEFVEQGFFDEMIHLLTAGLADLFDRPFDSFIDPGGQLSLGHDALLDCVYYQKIAAMNIRWQQPPGSSKPVR
jgi:hypothetical protein